MTEDSNTWPIGEAEVVMYDPRLDSTQRSYPYKIIDASIQFMGDAEIGDYLYSANQVDLIIRLSSPAKPFSTYPDDREKLIKLARIIQSSSDSEESEKAADSLSDLVLAILSDEA